MSSFRKGLGRLFASREKDARRHLEVYLRTADPELLRSNGFDVEKMDFRNPKYLPF